VIVADHGSRLPNHESNEEINRQHIPVIWAGGAIKNPGTIIHTVSSQTDIASTLLNQLNLNAGKFLFSKNVLSSEYNPFAFYTYNEGFGFITPQDYLVYNTITGKFPESRIASDTSLPARSKAYLQLLYTDFFRVYQGK